MTRADVLIFVEDPGAANYVAQLPIALQQQGYQVKLLADGVALDYLKQRSIVVERVTRDMTAPELLEAIAPSLLLVGTSENPDTLALPLIQTASTHNIPTLGVIDALSNADYRFRGRTPHPLAFAPDWLLVPDQWTQVAFQALGYPPDRIQLCGHPHYDVVLERAEQLKTLNLTQLRQTLLPGWEGDRPILLFAAEVSTGLNPTQYQWSPEYTLTGRGVQQGRTEIVLEEFLDAVSTLPERPYLILRLHPKNTRQELAPYLGEFDQISQGGSALDLLYATDLIVGMTSMLLTEALLLGKPILSILPKPAEQAALPLIAAGAIPCATTRREIRTQLAQLLVTGSGQAQAIAQQISSGATQRVADFIHNQLQGF